MTLESSHSPQKLSVTAVTLLFLNIGTIKLNTINKTNIITSAPIIIFIIEGKENNLPGGGGGEIGEFPKGGEEGNDSGGGVWGAGF
ncbi:hypothetical protein M1146_01770 [Patescibacteria group bacterium]|nr:hypothetical protein [Patescibacteria group bacterium]